MPSHQPFTALCQAMAPGPHANGRADLHVHSTHSDGTYTPEQIVGLARRCGLSAVSITDHDTMTAIPEAQRAATEDSLEIVPGVEISCEDQGREFHLLGYFIRIDDPDLLSALSRLQLHRRERYWEMIDRLRSCGVVFDEEAEADRVNPGSLGRRHLAAMLVEKNFAGSIREAFARYLGDRGRASVPKRCLPIREGIALVRGAGGIAAWAHPPYHCTQERLLELRAMGLQAVEADYPGWKQSRRRHLRQLAAELGLAITGGSDCHGDGHYRSDLGACGVSPEELTKLRRLAFSRGL